MQCESLTRKNEHCKNKKQKGSLYCATHQHHVKKNGEENNVNMNGSPGDSNLNINESTEESIIDSHETKSIPHDVPRLLVSPGSDVDDEISEKDLSLFKPKRKTPSFKRKLNINTSDASTSTDDMEQHMVYLKRSEDISDDSMKLMMYELGDLRSEKEKDSDTNADWDKITAACNKARFKVVESDNGAYLWMGALLAVTIGGLYVTFNRFRH